MLLFSATSFCQDTIKETGKIPQPSVYENGQFSPLFSDAFVIKEDTLLIASSKDSSLYFYVNEGSKWKLHQRVMIDIPVGNFGESVVWEGNTIAVGDYMGPGLNRYIYQYVGAVYIFQRNNHKWEHKQTLFSPSDEHDQFGTRLSLSDHFLMVSAPMKTNCNETNRTDCEHTTISRNYIFELKNNEWVYKQKFPENDPSYFFGQPKLTMNNEIVMSKDATIYFLNLNDKNNWVVTDSIYEKEKILRLYAYTKDYLVISDVMSLRTILVYTKNDQGKWQYSQTISEQNPKKQNTGFGGSIATTDNEIAIGAPSEKAIWGFQGAVHIYTKNEKGTFTKTQVLLASDGEKGDRFGSMTFFSGNDLIIMAQNDLKRVFKQQREDVINSYPGDIYFFKR